LLYSIIVIGGLAIGMAVFMGIIQWSSWHLSFDKHYTRDQNLYRLTLHEQIGDFDRQLAYIIHYEVVKQVYNSNAIPEIKHMGRLSPFRNTVVRNKEQIFYEDRSYICDQELLPMFKTEILIGNPDSVLIGPSKIILSETSTRKYFGEENPVGKLIEVQHQFARSSTNYEVSGVFKDYPANSHFKIDMLASYLDPSEFEGAAWFYLDIEKRADIAKIEREIQRIIKENNTSSYAEGIYPKLTQVKDIHLKSNLGREIDKNSDVRTLITLFIAGFFVFVLAWFNFTLLSVSQNQIRINKLIYQWQLGAGKKQFFREFFIDYLCVGFLGLILAILVSLLVNSTAIDYLELQMETKRNIFLASILLLFFFLLVSAALTAYFTTIRFYRLLQLNYFATTGRSYNRSKQRDLLIKSVIIVEFVITFILISNLYSIQRQIAYSMQLQLGANDTTTIQIIDLPRPIINDFLTFRTELQRYPVFKEITAMQEEPGGEANDAFKFRLEGFPTSDDMLYLFAVEENFVRFYDLELIAGEDFPDMYDNTDTTEYFILNETAARMIAGDAYTSVLNSKLQLDFSFPGYVYGGNVIGIVRDFHLASLSSEVNPMVIFPEYTWLYCISIRLAGDPTQAIEQLSRSWQELYPQYPLRYFFTSDLHRATYKDELAQMKLFLLFSLLSILISASGLFALSGFLTQQKNHSAAIRKVHGAGIREILGRELWQYVRLSVISSLIAFPFAYLSITKWLLNYHYQIAIPWLIFPVCTLFLILFSCISVLYHSFRLANSNPTKFIHKD
jgi:putative ABC transport system permease protein